MVMNDHTLTAGKILATSASSSASSSSSFSWEDGIMVADSSNDLVLPPLVPATHAHTMTQNDDTVTIFSSDNEDNENQPLLLVEGTSVVSLDDHNNEYNNNQTREQTTDTPVNGRSSSPIMMPPTSTGHHHTNDRSHDASNLGQVEMDQVLMPNMSDTDMLYMFQHSNSTTRLSRSYHLVQAAGMASGLLGWICCGPFIGLVLGLSVAYYASQPPGTIGSDTAQAIGILALQAHLYGQQINERHHVMERFRIWIQCQWEEAIQYDREHHVIQRVQDGIVHQIQTVSNFVHQHHVVDKCTHQICKWVDRIIDKHADGHPRHLHRPSPSTLHDHCHHPHYDHHHDHHHHP